MKTNHIVEFMLDEENLKRVSLSIIEHIMLRTLSQFGNNLDAIYSSRKKLSTQNIYMSEISILKEDGQCIDVCKFHLQAVITHKIWVNASVISIEDLHNIIKEEMRNAKLNNLIE